ncbi:MAG TPA: DUF4091 domain-containing protein [Anaeromyxobacteraceae bacterium]|nr:DUF4091 domain-containing protein [Anaeromyxobacteraceae bacterium]
MTRAALVALLCWGLPGCAAAHARPERGAAPARGAEPQRGAEPARGVEIGVTSGMEKLRPADGFPRARAIELTAARGECESAQIAVRAPGGLAALSADASPLGGDPPVEVTLYRVVMLDLPLPSGPDGEAGAWPDPLVPARDPYFGEARRAFPVKLAPREVQAIWVEVCVPARAPARSWRGEVVLRERGTAIARVPIHLRSWAFEIPATTSVPVTFGLSTRLGTEALGRFMDRDTARSLAAAALRHRVTPHGLSHDPPSGRCDGDGCRLDWSGYDAEMAPILDGTLVPGVRGTWAEARIPKTVWDGPEPILRQTLRAWRKHFEERGWGDRLWLYTLDEPKPEQLKELARRARVAREAGVRVFVTHEPIPALQDVVTTFVPNLTFFDEGALSLRSALRRPDRGARPFWYASCLSHGCDELPPRGKIREQMVQRFQGWPGYEIDRPSAAARAMAWLAWREQVAGELYFDMIYAWRGDPWRDPRAFAGNGDGTLLYPGLTSRWGGSRPFPVESIRLKLIRDGLEDLEMLRLADRAGLHEEAARIAQRVAPSIRGFSRDPDAWLAARRELGELLERRLAVQPARANR